MTFKISWNTSNKNLCQKNLCRREVKEHCCFAFLFCTRFLVSERHVRSRSSMFLKPDFVSGHQDLFPVDWRPCVFPFAFTTVTEQMNLSRLGKIGHHLVANFLAILEMKTFSFKKQQSFFA